MCVLLIVGVLPAMCLGSTLWIGVIRSQRACVPTWSLPPRRSTLSILMPQLLISELFHLAYYRKCTWARWQASHSLSFLLSVLLVSIVCSRVESGNLEIETRYSYQRCWEMEILISLPSFLSNQMTRAVGSVINPCRGLVHRRSVLDVEWVLANVGIFWRHLIFQTTLN